MAWRWSPGVVEFCNFLQRATFRGEKEGVWKETLFPPLTSSVKELFLWYVCLCGYWHGRNCSSIPSFLQRTIRLFTDESARCLLEFFNLNFLYFYSGLLGKRTSLLRGHGGWWCGMACFTLSFNPRKPFSKIDRREHPSPQNYQFERFNCNPISASSTQ